MAEIEIALHLKINQPIEIEMNEWLRHMEQSNRSYAVTTIWGRKQKREAEIYADAFKMAREHLKKELECVPVSKRWKND